MADESIFTLRGIEVTHQRDLLVVKIMIIGGARVSELIPLDTKHLRLNGPNIRVIFQKKGRKNAKH